jgi:hypothetical protein
MQNKCSVYFRMGCILEQEKPSFLNEYQILKILGHEKDIFKIILLKWIVPMSESEFLQVFNSVKKVDVLTEA